MSVNAENAHRQWATDEEYVAHGGNHCPACGSENLEGGHVSIHAGRAVQEVTCDDCCAEWEDNYKLVGYA